MPADGAAFVASKIDAIAANPDVWAKTAFILNYDENDGLFDHVAPPVPPAGHAAASSWTACPSAAGFRVPCIIVSPWTAGGWVCSQPFDHTSVLQFLEKFTGVREPNITEWRRQTFGDLTSAFRFNAERCIRPASRTPLTDSNWPVTNRPTCPNRNYRERTKNRPARSAARGDGFRRQESETHGRIFVLAIFARI